MAQPEERPRANAGPTRRLAPRVAAVFVAAMFIVLAFGVAARASGAAHDPAASAVAAAGASGRIALVDRSSGANAFVALAPPVEHRRIALGDLSACAVALAVAYLLGKRAHVGTVRRLRYDAVFAFRRGPPTISVAY